MKSCVSFCRLLFQTATEKHTHIEWSADGNPTVCWQICVTLADLSHQFWARKSTRAREVFSDMRTAKWRPVSFKSCETEENKIK